MWLGTSPRTVVLLTLDSLMFLKVMRMLCNLLLQLLDQFQLPSTLHSLPSSFTAKVKQILDNFDCT